ncbi:hypothetical protein AVEN_243859-1 [Araneus ventricosus]|uniref:Uncharacterized protein n=1 Tax=Araneus ventricosus TaxID=182803 RepID=A0A4Y2A836_ARAVE|nr:hypothetical protein AVEN_243859-1 [Araneus ventricosus]
MGPWRTIGSIQPVESKASNSPATGLTPRFEAARGVFGDKPRNFEPWSVDEETPEPASSSPNFLITPAGGRSTLGKFKVDNAHIYSGLSVDSGLEPTTLLSVSRDSATKPPWPQYHLEIRNSKKKNPKENLLGMLK